MGQVWENDNNVLMEKQSFTHWSEELKTLRMGDWLPQCNWIIFETKYSSYTRLDTEDDKKSIGREQEKVEVFKMEGSWR